MAIQIPSGDQFGNVSPQVGRTRLQGGNGLLGRAMIGVGRDVQRIGLQIEAENDQLNQVQMGNAILAREKQVNDLKNTIDEKVRLGQLDPDAAPDEYLKQLNTLPKTEINGLNNYQRETLNYSYNRVDYRGQQQVFSIYQQGRVVKAQTQISELERNARENNYTPEQFSSMLNSDPVKSTFSLGYGIQSEENRSNLERGYTVNYLQNQIMIASDKGDYKALKNIYNQMQLQLKPNAVMHDNAKGMIEKGNIDLYNRPIVQNKDGSISTVRTISINADDKEYLIPTVSPDGKLLNDNEAIKLFEETGQHLGAFNNATDATAYANKLHKQQESYYSSDVPYKGILQQDDRVKLAHAANRYMKTIESERRAAQSQLKSDIAYSDQNMLAASANGDLLDNPYSKKDYINAFGQKEGERRYKTVSEWQNEVAPAITSYQSMTIDEIVKDVESSKPSEEDSDRYVAKDKLSKFKAAAAQQVINEKINNPFNAAIKTGLFKPITSTNPDDLTNEIVSRYSAQPELQRLGINTPLLSKNEADILSQSIRGAKDINSQMQLLKSLGDRLPPEALKQVSAQIAPNSGAVAFSAMLLNTPDIKNASAVYKEIPVSEAVSRAFDPKERNKPRPLSEAQMVTVDKYEAAKTILQGDQLLNPTEAMKKIGIAKVSLPSDNKLKDSFDNYVGNAFQYNPQAYQLAFDIYKKAYAGLAYTAGGTDERSTSEVSTDISGRAALMATGGITKNASNVWGVSTSKKAVVMPYGMDESTFKDRYKTATISSLKEAGLNYNGWDDLTPINIGANTYRLAYGDTGRWAINPKTGDFVTVEIE